MGTGNVTGLANTIHPSILVAGRVLVLFIFAAAVVGKLRHREEFIGVVANYRIVPPVAVAWTAWLLIGLEIAVVVCLATGFELIAGAALAIFLLCAFAAATPRTVDHWLRPSSHTPHDLKTARLCGLFLRDGRFLLWRLGIVAIDIQYKYPQKWVDFSNRTDCVC